MFEMSTDPFRPLMTALAANGRKETNPRPESARHHQIRLPRTDLPLMDSPGSTGTKAAPEHPLWHVLGAHAPKQRRGISPLTHADMPVAHLPTSPAPGWLSLRKLLDLTPKGPRLILCAAQGTGGAEVGFLRPLTAV